MRRREFIAGLGGVAMWPAVALAQPVERTRRIGILSTFSESDVQIRSLIIETIQVLTQLGWERGRNIRIDERWAAGDVGRMGTLARELVALQPDVILALGMAATAALQSESRSIPIIFTIVADPLGSGFVASLARPGGNITG